MIDAKLTSLSKIEVGQTILVADMPGLRGFARPKDPDALRLRVTAKAFVPDSWSGKVWTLTLEDGTETTGRYGTTHVYVVEPAAAEADATPKWKTNKSKGKWTGINAVQRGDVVLVEESIDGKTALAKRPPAGDPFQVRGMLYQNGITTLILTSPDGRTLHGGDPHWTVVGHEEIAPLNPGVQVTKAGREVKVEANGKVTLTDAQLDERNAGQPDPKVVNSDRCGQCKGYGVVRKRGDHAGQAYKTANGADAATANGNSAMCPACRGASLVSRTA